MPSWHKRWRGFTVDIRYPKLIGRRHVGGQDQPVAPPRVEPPLPRDPQRALDFIRPASLQGDGTQPNPIAQTLSAEFSLKRTKATTLAEVVAAIPWYHTIDLGDGVVTPGVHDLRSFVKHVGIPEDLRGKRVLDVATFDGFWAFECERRGAEVVAIDVPSAAEMDLPRGGSDILRAENLDVPHGEAFTIAHEALHSKVQWVPCSVYDLNPVELGTFDLVHVGAILLHLRNPLDALRRVRDVAHDQLILVDRFDPLISGTGERLLRYQGGWNDMEWWAPSLETLQQWVVDAGFAPPTLLGTYPMSRFDPSLREWCRAVLHSTVVT